VCVCVCVCVYECVCVCVYECVCEYCVVCVCVCDCIPSACVGCGSINGRHVNETNYPNISSQYCSVVVMLYYCPDHTWLDRVWFIEQFVLFRLLPNYRNYAGVAKEMPIHNYTYLLLL
jgi:hypothetical protein